MGRTCVRDHRADHLLGNPEWLNGCAQCEVEHIRMSLAAALGWPRGVDGEPTLDELLRMVAEWRRRLTLASRVMSRADHA